MSACRGPAAAGRDARRRFDATGGAGGPCANGRGEAEPGEKVPGGEPSAPGGGKRRPPGPAESGARPPGGEATQTPAARRAAPAAAATAEIRSGFLAPEVLGRPTDHSVTVNVLPATDLEVYVEYGAAPDSLYRADAAGAGAGRQTLRGHPQRPAAECAHLLPHALPRPGAAVFAASEERSFHTQRAPGSTFTFDIQGDSHPERVKNQFDADLYARTLRSAAADQPDFYLTIGDDFSVDTLKTVNAEHGHPALSEPAPVAGAGRHAPVFLVNGNHEQASLANLDGTPDNVAVWAQNARNAYYPQPAPDGFYTGDASRSSTSACFATTTPGPGAMRCSWSSTPTGTRRSRGQPVRRGPRARRQARPVGCHPRRGPVPWLKQTLETSTAKYKFVFAHHVCGTGRGGIELAGLYEWGGRTARPGLFAAHRPGWDEADPPAHGRQPASPSSSRATTTSSPARNWTASSTRPCPSRPTRSTPSENADAYRSGDKLPNSGHARRRGARAGEGGLRPLLPAGRTKRTGRVNGEVAYLYHGRRGGSAAPLRHAVAHLPAPSGSGRTGPRRHDHTATPCRPARPHSGCNIVLGRPTDDSVTASLLSEVALDGLSGVWTRHRACTRGGRHRSALHGRPAG